MPRTLISTIGKWYGLFLVVLPASALVLGGIPYEVREGTLAALALGCAFCALAGVCLFRKPRFLFPASLLTLLSIPLLLIALFSMVQGGSLRNSLWGTGFEVGAVGSLLLFVAATISGALFTKRVLLLNTFLIATTVTSLLCIVAVFFFSEGWGKSISENWSQISFLIMGALCTVLILLDIGQGGLQKYFYIGGALILGGTFSFFFNIPSAILSVCVTVVVSGLLYWGGSLERRRPPFYVGVGILFILMLFFFGVRGPLLNVSPDIRPSFLATELVAASLYLDSLPHALVGAGPNAFEDAWNRYRPPLFNRYPQWNVTPKSACSTAATLAIDFGWLGLFALLLCPLALLYSIIRKVGKSVRRTIVPAYDAVFAGACTLALFSFGALFIYPVGTSFLLLAGIGLGMCASVLSEDTISVSAGFVGRICIILLCAASGLGLLWISGHQFAAAYYHARAEKLATTSALGEAAQTYEWAAGLWPIAIYESAAARGNLRFAFASIEQGGAPDATSAEIAITKAETFSQAANGHGNVNFEAALSAASVYVSLAGAGLSSTEEETQRYLSLAQSAARTRPETFFLRAVYAEVLGKSDDARGYIKKALDLKPDYEDALRLSAQLNLQQ